MQLASAVSAAHKARCVHGAVCVYAGDWMGSRWSSDEHALAVSTSGKRFRLKRVIKEFIGATLRRLCSYLAALIATLGIRK